MTIVYHGSYTAIEKIDLAFSGASKDFGRGFYVTNLLEQANIWAKRIGRDRRVKGVVAEFELDEFVYTDRDLKTLRFDDYTD